MKRANFLLKTREILRNRRDALRRCLNSELVALQRTPGEDDEGQDSETDAVLSELAHYESRELAAIENALERMRQGEYGACQECGQNIPLARLEALPYATLCIRCQRELEGEGQARTRAVPWSSSRGVRLQDDEPPLDMPDLMLS